MLQRFKSSVFVLVLGITFASLSASSPRAAAIWDFSGGKLHGAQNVEVNGAFYDVVFGDGTCLALFSPCNDSGTFAFTTLVDANEAALALLGQVFLDDPIGGSPALLDANPPLTHGCEPATGSICSVYIPYGIQTGTLFVNAAIAHNFKNAEVDITASTTSLVNSVDLNQASVTYAVFSPAVSVPAPAALPLLLSALAGLGFLRWHRRAG